MSVATLENNIIRLKCHYLQKDIAKTIPGYKWNPEAKCWEYPIQPEVYLQLKHFPDIKIDERIKAAVQEVQETLREVKGIKDSTGLINPVEPMPITIKPYRHQIIGYNIAMKLKHSALFMEQGCGKTLTAIAVMGRRFLRGEINRVLIVSPASVMPVWLLEINRYADFSNQTYIPEGSLEQRERFFWEHRGDNGKLQVAIVNYEAVWRFIPYNRDAHRWHIDKSVFTKMWNPDMIICDESQRIKSPGALQSKGLHRLGMLAKYRMLLTGTPVTNNPLDIFSQYKFLEPSIFGPTYTSFKNRYAIAVPIVRRKTPGSKEGQIIIGYKNLDELIKKAHSIAYRVTKEEALDLPDFVDQELYCQLEKKAQLQYNEMKRESILQLSEEEFITAANILTKLLRLSQITGGYMKDESERSVCISNAKMQLLEEVVDDLIGAGKKAVIFVRFIPEIRAIRKMLEKQNIDYAWIAGEVKDRAEQVERFQEDENCKIFIAQIQTAGLGITLTAADTAIFYSLSYSYADYDQARARIHRIGQKNKCTYIHLIAQDTVDEKVLTALKQKKSIADEIVDNWKMYFREDDTNGNNL